MKNQLHRVGVAYLANGLLTGASAACIKYVARRHFSDKLAATQRTVFRGPVEFVQLRKLG